MATYSLPSGGSNCCKDGVLECPDDLCGDCVDCVDYYPCVRYPAFNPNGKLCDATLKKDNNGDVVMDGPPDSLECVYILDCGYSTQEVLKSSFSESTDCCPYDYDDGYDEYYVYYSFCDPNALWKDPDSPYYYAAYMSLPTTLYWNKAECCFISSDGFKKYCPQTDEYSEGNVVFVDPYADFGAPSESRIHPDDEFTTWWENVDTHRLVTDDPTLGGTPNVNIDCIPK